MVRSRGQAWPDALSAPAPEALRRTRGRRYGPQHARIPAPTSRARPSAAPRRRRQHDGHARHAAKSRKRDVPAPAHAATKPLEWGGTTAVRVELPGLLLPRLARWSYPMRTLYISPANKTRQGGTHENRRDRSARQGAPLWYSRRQRGRHSQKRPRDLRASRAQEP